MGERMRHARHNQLTRDQKMIIEEVTLCEEKERESLSVLGHLVTSHAALEQKIRPQMKMLLHKMSLVEQRIQRITTMCTFASCAMCSFTPTHCAQSIRISFGRCWHSATHWISNSTRKSWRWRS